MPPTMTPNNALDLTSPFRHNQTFLCVLNWVGPRGFGSMFGDAISVSTSRHEYRTS
jgi:hypothetical protein